MIRELKSLTQLRALVLAELGKYDEFKQIVPEVASLREPDPSGCNWDVSCRDGPRERLEADASRLTAVVEPLRRRYKAIAVRSPGV